jgi:thioredoxin 1
MVAPTLEKLAKEFSGKVLVTKVNTDEDAQWAQKYNVQSIPTMLFLHNGKIVHTQVGALPEGTLRQIFTQFLEITSTN